MLLYDLIVQYHSCGSFVHLHLSLPHIHGLKCQELNDCIHLAESFQYQSTLYVPGFQSGNVKVIHANDNPSPKPHPCHLHHQKRHPGNVDLYNFTLSRND